MPELKDIETAILLTMLAAHAECYLRLLTQKEATRCKETINMLRSEIEFRKKDRIDMTIARAGSCAAQKTINRSFDHAGFLS